MRPRRTPSAKVRRNSASSRWSINHPSAGWFSQRCSACIRSKSIRLYSAADIAKFGVSGPAAGCASASVWLDQPRTHSDHQHSRSPANQNPFNRWNTGGSILRSSALTASMVGSLTCTGASPTISMSLTTPVPCRQLPAVRECCLLRPRRARLYRFRGRSPLAVLGQGWSAAEGACLPAGQASPRSCRLLELQRLGLPASALSAIRSKGIGRVPSPLTTGPSFDSPAC